MDCSCVVLELLWGDTPHPRGKEKPQQDDRRGETAFRIKPHTCQRCSEGSNKPCVHQDPETPQRLRQNCVWVSSVEVHVSSGLLQGQGLWVQQTWIWHKPFWRRSPISPPYSHQNLHRTGKQTLARYKQDLVCTRNPWERINDTTRDWPRLAHECPSRSLQWRGGSEDGLLQGWGHCVQ